MCDIPLASVIAELVGVRTLLAVHLELHSLVAGEMCVRTGPRPREPRLRSDLRT